MKLGRIFGYGLLGIAGLAAILVFVLLWRWYVPSPSALRLTKLYAQRTAVPDAVNAYIYLWGFSAPPGADALAMGRERIRWLQHREANPDAISPDPLGEELELDEMRSGRMKALGRHCAGSPAGRCAADFDAWPAEPDFSARELDSLARYREMIAYQRWFESVAIPAAEGPLPPFGVAFDAQRVQMLELRQAATSGDVARVRDTLQRDLVFWREVLKSSDILISKMLACASIRNHFFLGNLVLRRLPPEKQAGAIPPAWREPFSSEEVSLLRAAAGEFNFSRGQIHEWRSAGTAVDDFDDESAAEDWLDSVALRVRPWQRDLNRIAEAYLTLAEDFAVPLDQYAVTRDRYERRFADNPASKGLSGYAVRVGGVEGMRRAALLTAELRSRGVTEAAISGELAAADSKNPFTRQPFEWDARQHAVIFDSLDSARASRHIYLY